jgi:hypothetical protein
MNKLDNVKPNELKQAITTRYKRPDLVYKHIKRNLSNLLQCNYVEWSLKGNTLYIRADYNGDIQKRSFRLIGIN